VLCHQALHRKPHFWELLKFVEWLSPLPPQQIQSLLGQGYRLLNQLAHLAVLLPTLFLLQAAQTMTMLATSYLWELQHCWEILVIGVVLSQTLQDLHHLQQSAPSSQPPLSTVVVQ
jgi:hypothetical protein